VATDGTNVVANLLSRGTVAARVTVIGRLRTTRNRGGSGLTLKLSAAGKKALRGKRSAKLTLVVKASGPSAKAATLTANLAAGK
jgi:hypothetical protein